MLWVHLFECGTARATRRFDSPRATLSPILTAFSRTQLLIQSPPPARDGARFHNCRANPVPPAIIAASHNINTHRLVPDLAARTAHNGSIHKMDTAFRQNAAAGVHVAERMNLRTNALQLPPQVRTAKMDIP